MEEEKEGEEEVATDRGGGEGDSLDVGDRTVEDWRGDPGGRRRRRRRRRRKKRRRSRRMRRST